MAIVAGDIEYPDSGDLSYCRPCMEDCEDSITQLIGGIINTLGSWAYDIADCADDPPLLFSSEELSSSKQQR